jgi:NAD(P)H-hydrate epimerase
VALGLRAEQVRPLPAEQLAILERLEVRAHEGVHDALGEPDLVLDALLGYGQHGDPYGDAAELIRWSQGRRVLALDVPSGLELSTEKLRTPHVTAEATMTLAAPKAGLAGAVDEVGALFVADISVPALVYRRLGLDYETPFGRGPLIEVEMSR